MCFCFDGENALTAYRPDDCRDRLPAESARAPDLIASHAEPDRDADSPLEPGDGGRRLAVVRERMY